MTETAPKLEASELAQYAYTITRDNSYLGKWTLTFNGKVSHHFRKVEAQARGVSVYSIIGG